MSQQTPVDLSPYELHRKPQELITDGTSASFSKHCLGAELTCPICLDILRNTMTTKDCVHRFCQECITTALRNGNKECPTCRQKLVSKRSLRPDKNIDELISKLYPHRDMDVEVQKQYIEKARQHMLAMKRKRSAIQDKDSPDSKQSVDSLEDQDIELTRAVCPPPMERVELRFHPHPDDSSLSGLSMKVLSTTPSTTIGHLVKYLSVRSTLQRKERGGTDGRGNTVNGVDCSFSVSLAYPPTADPVEYVTLPRDMTLEQVCIKYWKPDDILDMYFSTSNS